MRAVLGGLEWEYSRQLGQTSHHSNGLALGVCQATWSRQALARKRHGVGVEKHVERQGLVLEWQMNTFDPEWDNEGWEGGQHRR